MKYIGTVGTCAEALRGEAEGFSEAAAARLIGADGVL